MLGRWVPCQHTHSFSYSSLFFSTVREALQNTRECPRLTLGRSSGAHFFVQWDYVHLKQSELFILKPGSPEICKAEERVNEKPSIQPLTP